MLCSRLRVRPCRLRFSLASLGRVTWMTSPSWVMVMAGCSCWVRVPLGPFTVTRLPASIFTSTPAGMEIGILPIRDIFYSPSLPDKRQDFTADMGRAGGLVGHDALGRGHDGNAQAAENAGQLVSTGIDTQAGLGDAAQAGDNLLLAGVVLQGNADNALGAVVDELEVLDIALVQQDLRDGLLHVGRR